MQRRSILITRPVDDAAGPARRIEALGYTPVIAPMLRIVRKAPTIPANIQAILVTSGNALATLTPSAIPLLAVGDATAELARKKGFSAVHSAGRDAKSLAALAARLHRPEAGPLLLASGARQGQKLARDLRAGGFRVIRRVCYAAHPVSRFPAEAAAALQSGMVHAALFLSAETAAAFVRLLPPEFHHALATVAALAIGPSAAEVLEPLPWLRVCRAQKPNFGRRPGPDMTDPELDPPAESPAEPPRASLFDPAPASPPPPFIKTADPVVVRRRGGTPLLLTLLLFAGLAGGLYWVWTNPQPGAQTTTLASQPAADPQPAIDAAKAEVLAKLQALSERVDKLEKQPAAAPPADSQAASTAPACDPTARHLPCSQRRPGQASG